MGIFSKLERAVGLKPKRRRKTKAEHRRKRRRTPPRKKNGEFRKRKR